MACKIGAPLACKTETQLHQIYQFLALKSTHFFSYICAPFYVLCLSIAYALALIVLQILLIHRQLTCNNKATQYALFLSAFFQRFSFFALLCFAVTGQLPMYLKYLQHNLSPQDYLTCLNEFEKGLPVLWYEFYLFKIRIS